MSITLTTHPPEPEVKDAAAQPEVHAKAVEIASEAWTVDLFGFAGGLKPIRFFRSRVFGGFEEVEIAADLRVRSSNYLVGYAIWEGPDPAGEPIVCVDLRLSAEYPLAPMV